MCVEMERLHCSRSCTDVSCWLLRGDGDWFWSWSIHGLEDMDDPPDYCFKKTTKRQSTILRTKAVGS